MSSVTSKQTNVIKPIKSENMSVSNADDGASKDAVSANDSEPPDVRDEVIASLLKQNELLTKQVADLTAKIDTLTKQLTSKPRNVNTGLSADERQKGKICRKKCCKKTSTTVAERRAQ